MLGRFVTNKMAATSSTGQHGEFVDNSFDDFDDLEEFIPDLNEDGSGNICQECGYDIFTSAVICSNDVCSGKPGEPAVFHSGCVGENPDGEDVILMQNKEWLCPKCRVCKTSG